VSIEQIYSGEDVVTLKTRSSLGVLPEVNESAVPVEAHEKLAKPWKLSRTQLTGPVRSLL